MEPVKKGGRWEIAVRSVNASPSSGIQLVFTRQGVEIFGWYDHMVGVDDLLLMAWRDIDRVRAALKA